MLAILNFPSKGHSLVPNPLNSYPSYVNGISIAPPVTELSNEIM